MVEEAGVLGRGSSENCAGWSQHPTLAFSGPIMSKSKANSDNVIRREGRIEIRREKDKNGDDTGHAYRHCTACNRELMTGRDQEQTPWHEDDCPECDGQ
jgi:hypothetical protein